jgi:SAM-dependent methyltransferase
MGTSTQLDRYPAKMVGRLARTLAERYVTSADTVCDPFCGSGAILAAAVERGADVTGFDLNPFAVLLARVKLEGFEPLGAQDVYSDVIGQARFCKKPLCPNWANAEYWFTPATLEKYGRLRRALAARSLEATPEGRAVLLAFALSVRRCSRADQRSPKPFISKLARLRRLGRHFDPYQDIGFLLCALSKLYGQRTAHPAHVSQLDLTDTAAGERLGVYSKIVTSPPYLNAQDYYRNFKLELHMLDGVIGPAAEDLRTRFIGTERVSPCDFAESACDVLPSLVNMLRTHPKHAAIVSRYVTDMRASLITISRSLVPGGLLVLICGDNLVGGYRIPTYRVLNRLAEQQGLSAIETFGDPIRRRNVPPERAGHKALIKRERVTVFTDQFRHSRPAEHTRQLEATIPAGFVR